MAEASRILQTTLMPSLSQSLSLRKPRSQMIPSRRTSPLIIRCTISTGSSSSAAKAAAAPQTIPWGGDIDSSENSAALQKWLTESGLPPQKMDIQRVDVGERGLVAINNIRKGEKLLFVPPSLVISANSEWSFPEAGEVLKRYDVPDWPLIATYLISEASLMKSSRWSNYISALPRQPYSLLNWTRAELDRYLEASQIRERAIEWINNVTGIYNDLRGRMFSKRPNLFPEEVFNMETFRWSFGIPFSRLFEKLQNSIETQKSQDPELKQENSMKTDDKVSGGGGGGGDWTTSLLIFLLWGGLMYYVFSLAPNQTPSTDMYLLKKLLNLIGDDGFHLNQVIVSLWYIMGLWPLVYGMLLIPSGRSSQGKVPVFPFLVLSFFLGAYALIPYFVLWRPPTPPTDKLELKRWPLNFLESKLTAGITLATGLGLIVYAGSASVDSWKEYFQYFGGSKLIHLTSIDFTLLSTFAPFWVYNDMAARKWNDKGFWLVPLSLVPFLGPALYVLLRPPLSAVTVAPNLTKSEEK